VLVKLIAVDGIAEKISKTVPEVQRAPDDKECALELPASSLLAQSPDSEKRLELLPSEGSSAPYRPTWPEVTARSGIWSVEFLVDTYHHHHNLALATLHVHFDDNNCMEVTALRGKGDEVQHFADHIIAERGVKYGRVVMIPTAAKKGDAKKKPQRHT
jgi:hypothetical protein